MCNTRTLVCYKCLARIDIRDREDFATVTNITRKTGFNAHSELMLQFVERVYDSSKLWKYLSVFM